MASDQKILNVKVYPSPDMGFKIVDIVRDNNPAQFAFYRSGNMFYNVTVKEVISEHEGISLWKKTTYQFPVSLEDIGGASLFAEMKAITLMRYIRKAMEDKTFSHA